MISRENKLIEALEFYRDAWNMKPNKRYGGLEWSPKETLLDDCGNRAREALTADSAGQTIRYDGTGEDAIRKMAEEAEPQDVFLKRLVAEYLAAIDADPVKDIWDTWDGKPKEGAEMTSSDAAWEEHGENAMRCLKRLRDALTEDRS